jgi:hypothetical protein
VTDQIRRWGMVQMTAFSPTDVAFEGFRLTRERPVTLSIWAGFYFLVSLTMAIFMILSVGPQFTALEQAAQSGGDPQQSIDTLMKLLPFYAVSFPVGICVMAIFACAVFRIVLGRPGGVVAHLALGEDEFRLMAVTLAVSLLMMAAMFGIALIIGMIVGIATAIAPPLAPLLGTIGGLAAFAGMLWVAVRLSLCGPMTFAERRVVVFRAWSVTRNHFWQLFGAYILAFVMGIVAALMAYIVFVALAGVIMTALGGSLADVGQLFRPDFSSIGAFFTPAMILYQLFGATITAIYYAVVLAPQAMAYAALVDYHGDPEG